MKKKLKREKIKHCQLITSETSLSQKVFFRRSLFEIKTEYQLESVSSV